MQKYRIKTTDNTFDYFLLPVLSFALMNGDEITYKLQVYKGIWIFGYWKTIHQTHCKEDIYIHLMNDIYGIKIPSHFECKFNKKWKWFETYCKLTLFKQSNMYIAGYKSDQKFEEYCKSSISYEDALIKLHEKLKNITYKHDVEYGFLKEHSTFDDTF